MLRCNLHFSPCKVSKKSAGHQAACQAFRTGTNGGVSGRLSLATLVFTQPLREKYALLRGSALGSSAAVATEVESADVMAQLGHSGAAVGRPTAVRGIPISKVAA